MSQIRSVGARRPSRVIVHHRRPTLPPARLTALGPKPRDRRARSRSGGRVFAGSGSQFGKVAPRSALRIEVVRAVVLVAGAVLAVLFALPVLLERAAGHWPQ
jgi:hypothetical protein